MNEQLDKTLIPENKYDSNLQYYKSYDEIDLIWVFELDWFEVKCKEFTNNNMLLCCREMADTCGWKVSDFIDDDVCVTELFWDIPTPKYVIDAAKEKFYLYL